MPLALLILGGLLTLAGIGLLVSAYRLAQHGDADAERRRFRTAVAALAVGSVAILASTVLGGAG